MDSGNKRVAEQSGSRWPRLLRDGAIDLTSIVVSLWLTHALSANRIVPPDSGFVVLQGTLLGLLTVGLLALRGVYSINVRYIGLTDFLNVALVGLASVFGLVTLQQLGVPPAPTSTLIDPLFFGFLSVSFVGGVRIARRLLSWKTLTGRRGLNSPSPRRTIIIGAGDGGESIAREIMRSVAPGNHVLGFVDDDPHKSSLRIHGLRVLGTTNDIPRLCKELHVEDLLLAIPSAKGPDIRRIMDLCNQTSARVRILPQVKSILSGGPSHVSHLREVDIEDLLKREPVKTDLNKISGYLSGERVLITGGGGSIGSELARQIANLSPASLIIVGKGENSIYEIEQELVQTNQMTPECVIADVRDRQSLEAVFKQYSPTVVFHAAAHKHVPLMEGNPIEAIRNNVWGTWLTAETAIRHGAQKFIYVSTDKAVKPSSIMGATKRVGEMIISALGRKSETQFAIVRFGNVMGSRGSLIPLLKAQIKRGGPVRVTHADMTRYFMTIPEAVQLILQAGAIGESGEIFLLDMGEPLKIVDIATDLIRLSGLSLGEDIQIQYTGVRPGEKIHEELLYEQEELAPTSHPKISMVSHDSGSDWDALRREIEVLLDFCEQGKAEEARRCLMELAWGKSPSQEFSSITVL